MAPLAPGCVCMSYTVQTANDLFHWLRSSHTSQINNAITVVNDTSCKTILKSRSLNVMVNFSIPTKLHFLWLRSKRSGQRKNPNPSEESASSRLIARCLLTVIAFLNYCALNGEPLSLSLCLYASYMELNDLHDFWLMKRHLSLFYSKKLCYNLQIH